MGFAPWHVALVMLFHFNVPGVAGGFIGVDVFFVVSGYLMTSIIVSQHEAGTFFLKFYLHVRAASCPHSPRSAPRSSSSDGSGWTRRTIAHWARRLLRASSSRTSCSPTRSAISISTRTKWSLHTWSLSWSGSSVLYPVVIFAIVRYARRWLEIILPVLLVASLAHYVELGGHRSSDAFYLFCRARGSCLPAASSSCSSRACVH